jgi:hypothetical protein
MIRIEMSEASYGSVVGAVRRILTADDDIVGSYPRKFGLCQGCGIAIDVALECATITKDDGTKVTYDANTQTKQA